MHDQALLRLLQLFDSQFPVGAFAQSGGLETYAQAGADVRALQELLENQIHLGWGRGDLAAAALAWDHARQAPRLLASLGAQVEALKIIRSVRDASRRLGQRTLALAARLYPEAVASLDLARPYHAVVVGALGFRLGLPQRELLLAFGQSTALASLAAATRCMPISPAQAQAVLVALQPSIARAVELVLADPEDALFTCTPALDVRCHQQAFLTTRLFQS